MLLGLGLGLLLPHVYLFLISSGGFALLFTYVIIMATHIRFRKKNGCPPDGKCQLWGFPITSLVVLLFLVGTLLSMPFVPGQTYGLIAGIALIVFYTVSYFAVKLVRSLRRQESTDSDAALKHFQSERAAENAEELTDLPEEKEEPDES